MKLVWMKNEPFTQELLESWTLLLVDKDGKLGATHRLGALYRLEDGSYVLIERRRETAPMYLDADLSLEEAQRAAKLFLCVGGQQ